jgi:hypothetical protein
MESIDLASGHISSTDVLSIDLIQPDTNPALVRIRWPDRPTHCRGWQVPRVRSRDHEDPE